MSCYFKFLLLLLMCGAAYCADLPDAKTTPGAVNANVTQSNIASTVCAHNWTAAIRPPASYTNKLKAKQMASGVYASKAAMKDFEEDHLISLELGGNPTDERNLWPQHWSRPFGAHEKDRLENYLKRQVCAGKMTLVEAQNAISYDWIAEYKRTFK